jgi:hypothetical protein
MSTMWNFFNCYLSGRHDYGMWCEPGQIFLRCMHCGKRSSGWAMDQKRAAVAPAPAKAPPVTLRPAPGARIVPFSRAAAG